METAGRQNLSGAAVFHQKDGLMKRRLLLAILIACFLNTSNLCAQGAGGQQPQPAQPQSAPSQPAAGTPAQTPPPADAGAPLSRLDLSPDQKKQIHTIRKEAQQQVQKVRSDTSLTPQQQTQQIRQIRRSAAQQVDGVLTPEQKTKYDAWRKAHQRPHHAAKAQPA